MLPKSDLQPVNKISAFDLFDDKRMDGKQNLEEEF